MLEPLAEEGALGTCGERNDGGVAVDKRDNPDGEDEGAMEDDEGNEIGHCAIRTDCGAQAGCKAWGGCGA